MAQRSSATLTPPARPAAPSAAALGPPTPRLSAAARARPSVVPAKAWTPPGVPPAHPGVDATRVPEAAPPGRARAGKFRPVGTLVVRWPQGDSLGRVSTEQARRSTVTTRVLVVEDEENTRILFGDILRHLAYEPILARSAEAARAAIESAAPDIILLDVRLPLMSGYEFLRLRAIRESKIPIVAVSGAATESDARSCLHFGALDFLRKPVALDLLRAVLQYAAVRAREGHRDLEREAGNRRRSVRPQVVLPVRVVEQGGPTWTATCVDLSTFGMRLRLNEPIAAEPAVRLHFTPGDGGTALSLLAPLVRRTGNDYAFRFVNLTEVDFKRLTEYVVQLTN